MTRFIDCTPSWSQVVPTLRVLAENGNDSGREVAWSEITRMAHLADKWVEHCTESATPATFVSRRGNINLPS